MLPGQTLRTISPADAILESIRVNVANLFIFIPNMCVGVLMKKAKVALHDHLVYVACYFLNTCYY